MSDSSIPRIQVSPDTVLALAPLFQKGIQVDIQTGCTVKSLLLEQWDIPADYVSERISTLFLDGKPVDDMNEAHIKEGAVLALSSAMPGLVGAVMRRGGYYASLRGGITYHETAADSDVRSGTITVKLFNLLIREIGPSFLYRGFRVSRRDLPDKIPAPPEGRGAPEGEVFIIAPPPSD